MNNKPSAGVVLDPRLGAACQSHPFPLLFATVSGAHLYGFPSPDSDWDLRGAHVLPLSDVIGLRPRRETMESARDEPGFELDLVTHDIEKFFRLLLKTNGYVLEQLHSPLIVHTTPEHDELRSIAAGCVTRHHVHHYLGFYRTQRGLLEKESPPRVKPLLYVYRVLLTGIHLMRTGVVEANLNVLNETFRLPYVADLVARKVAGAENMALSMDEVTFHGAEHTRLVAELERAGVESRLPEHPSAAAALDDLLVRIRVQGLP